MRALVQMWLMGLAAGVCLMWVLQKLPTLSSGASVSDWITVIAGIVVVISSVAAVIQATRSPSE